jgi:hypothetical protein
MNVGFSVLCALTPFKERSYTIGRTDNGIEYVHGTNECTRSDALDITFSLRV